MPLRLTALQIKEDMSIFDKVRSQLLGNDKEQNLTQASDQSYEDKQTCDYVRKKVEEARMNGSRVANESLWITNVAYLCGFDQVSWDPVGRNFIPNGAGRTFLSRNRIRVNKILPTVQNRLARLCKNPPKYDVRPNSNDPEDKDAARLAMQILEMLWDKERINKKRLELYMYMQQAGHSWMKVVWDTEMGRDIADPMTGEEIREGDIRVDVCSAFEIYVDPLAKNQEELSWLVQAKVRKLDYFKQQYPERGELVKEESAWLLSVQYENRINQMNPYTGSSSGSQVQMKDAAIELAYYERPCAKYKNGRMIITASGVLLDQKELPVGKIPFVKFDDVLVGGKFYPESIITHLRPIQDQYNRVISKRADWTNKLLAGKYLAAKGHGLSAEAINDLSGEVIEHNPVPGAPPPQAIQVPSIPQYAYQEEDKLLEQMYDIAGINEISRGQLPSASIPAAGMQFLLEQDSTRIGVVTESNEHSWSMFGQLLLMYAQEFYKTDRLIKKSAGMEYIVKEFKGSDIKGNTDVTVIRGSTIPGSKVLKRQEILNLYTQGLLGDPNDPKVKEKILSMLEYGDVAEAWADIAIDITQIKQQIEMIENGEVPPVDELDNHPLHIQEKNRYRKSDKFTKLPPENQKIMRDNIEAHIQAMVSLANPGLDKQKELADHMVQGAEQNLQQVPDDQQIQDSVQSAPQPIGA